jgi:hypothetical protein
MLIDDIENAGRAATCAREPGQDRIISHALLLRFVSIAASSLGDS